MESLTVRRRRRLFNATKPEGKPWKLKPQDWKAPVELKVRCGGKMHTIRLTKRGKLILLNHGNKSYDEAVSVQASLGGPKNKCREILAAWRAKGYSHPALNQLMWAWYGRKSDRCSKPRSVNIVKPNGKKHRHITGDPLANGNMVTRERDNTLFAIKDAFRRTAFLGSYYAKHNVSVEIAKTASLLKASVKQRITTSPRFAEHLTLVVGVSLRWLRNVGEHSMFDRHPVMELGPKTETKHSTSYVAKLIRIIETERGPLPVIQAATVYKKGRGWTIAWNQRSRPDLPTKIQFT
jgi:hypothetical protein